MRCEPRSHTTSRSTRFVNTHSMVDVMPQWRCCSSIVMLAFMVTTTLRFDRLLDVGGAPGTESASFTGRIDGTAGRRSVAVDPPRCSSVMRMPDSGHFREVGSTRVSHRSTLRCERCTKRSGVEVNPDNLIGRLDDYPTRSGYVMSPFVFWAGPEHEPIANPDEVASVHRVSFDELLRPDSPRFVEIEGKRSTRGPSSGGVAT